ncbi:MAG: single-stranded-DNA-specific exonuclease RecJ [Candidatus Sabulitectum sp.]|nr:single-stranded-DNA-specific exonuclease RecJ [Candidatus Sabulitectum sp.]
MKYKWLPRPEVRKEENSYSEPLGFPDPVESVVRRRGFGSAFIHSDYSELSPWAALPGADKASLILEKAIRNNELILVQGDFDADGITATATAIRVIRSLGGKAQFHVPCRFKEGYGLGETVVRKCIESGAGVLITVDCGITATEEVATLRKAGLKVVITDHHKPSGILPEADVLVDPELSLENNAPWRHLSGAGVIHFVLRGLVARMGMGDIPELEPDLVSIGTVCDMVSLTGDNRILVKRGLCVLRSNPSPGIKALMRASGVKHSELTARDIGFGLGPIINSSGRITHADEAVNLLLETDPRLAEEMASSLERVNKKRRSLDSTVFTQAGELLGKTDAHVAVAASDLWHPGVIGISASRLARQLNRPVILIAWDADSGRGSARGVQGMPVYPILSRATEEGFLLRFGGHDQAAGLSIEKRMYGEFKTFVESIAKSLYREVSGPVLYIDGGLDPENCCSSVLHALEELGPFGEGNPEPVWIVRGVYPVTFRSVGQEGKHLQVSFQHGENILRGIGFGLGHRTSELNRMLDIAFTLSADSWRGGDAVQLVIKDIKPAARRIN